MTTITSSMQSWLKRCSAAVLVVKPVLPPFHFPPFLFPLPQSEMMRKQLTFCGVKEMLTRFRNLQLHVLIYFHLDWHFPPSCLSPSSRRKNLYRVYVGRANNQSFPVTHKYTKHTLWASCGCALHTDTSYFLAQACVNPQGKGHRQRGGTKGRLSAGKPQCLAPWTTG